RKMRILWHQAPAHTPHWTSPLHCLPQLLGITPGPPRMKTLVQGNGFGLEGPPSQARRAKEGNASSLPHSLRRAFMRSIGRAASPLGAALRHIRTAGNFGHVFGLLHRGTGGAA